LIAGVILAAGTSSRLGRPKQLLELGGKPALQHVIDLAATAGLDEIVLVLGHEAPRVKAAIRLPPFARVAVNADYLAGQVTSLATGLSAVDPDMSAAVVLLGDQPSLPYDAFVKVLDRWRSTDASVVRATYNSAPGHPVVLGRESFAAFGEATGDDGARRVIARIGAEEVEMGQNPPADIDTWDQYQAVREAY
jgi:molybdenum cofactor cytidylyltransferase